MNKRDFIKLASCALVPDIQNYKLFVSNDTLVKKWKPLLSFDDGRKIIPIEERHWIPCSIELERVEMMCKTMLLKNKYLTIPVLTENGIDAIMPYDMIWSQGSVGPVVNTRSAWQKNYIGILTNNKLVSSTSNFFLTLAKIKPRINYE
jgi:hypothetical protein